jgi:predicted nucleotidyltransferase
VLVQFQPGQTPGWAIVSAENELATIFGRKVDLRTSNELSRWMIKDVMAEVVDEYVEA